MSPKALISALVLSVSLAATQVQAKPDMTPEQLTKAREVAAQMKPPVDFDELMNEADRLNVVCEGNLTIKGNIKTCKYRIETAQSKERQAKLDEEIKAQRAEIKRILDETKRIADQKLNK